MGCGNARSRWGGTRQVRVIDADLGRSGAGATARKGWGSWCATSRSGSGRDRLRHRGQPVGPQQRRLVSAAGPVRADRHLDRRRGRCLPSGGFQRPAGARFEGHDERGRAAPDPVQADRRPATQGRPRRAAAVPAGGFRLRPDWRGGDPPDEAVVEAIATVFRRFAELGTGRQVLLSLRGDGLLLPRRPTRTGRVVWRRPPTRRCTTCSPIRSMRGRSCSAAPAPRNASMRPARWCSAPCCSRASSGRCSFRITTQGSSTGPPMRRTPHGCGRTGVPHAGPAAVRRGKVLRCCRAGCVAGSAAG